MRKSHSNISPCVLLIILTFCALGPQPAVADPRSGSLVVIGGILRFDNHAVWRRIVELAGPEAAEMVVFPTASARPKIYGEFAVRALERYGAFVEHIPLSVRPSEFEVGYQQAVNDPALIEKVKDATGVFFVGGAPQRVARALFAGTDSKHAMAEAIRAVFGNGGVIAGGVVARTVVSSHIDPLQAMRQGLKLADGALPGLGLIEDGWFVDQHAFSYGRFATILVAMYEQGYKYALGVGVNTAVVITRGQYAEVIGDNGALVVDLSQAVSDSRTQGFNIKRVRLTHLDHGDRLDMRTMNTTPHASRLDGFEIDPNAGDHEPFLETQEFYPNVFAPLALKGLILNALDGERGDATGLAFDERGDDHAAGFEFRFYRGPDSAGWFTTQSGREEYTVVNIYLDVSPISKQAALEKKAQFGVGRSRR